MRPYRGYICETSVKIGPRPYPILCRPYGAGITIIQIRLISHPSIVPVLDEKLQPI